MKNIFFELFNLNTDRASFSEIEERIYSGGNIKGTNISILILAIFIASIGLNMNSTAIVIGAMLISPLMGVIMSIGYGMATYDAKYVRQSILKLLFQIVLSVITSTIYFSLSPIDNASSEILARTQPNIWDVLIAILGGLAGIIGNTRIEKSNVIPGVAIATALMPPLCTAGFGLSIHSYDFFFGALYLFFINSFFICLTTFIVLKLFKIPPKQYQSKQILVKQQWYLTILGIIIIIPSIWATYNMIIEDVTQNEVKAFIINEIESNNSHILSYKLNTKNNTLNINIIGNNFDDNEISNLQKKLNELPHLSEMQLNIVQNDIKGAINNQEYRNDNINKLKNELKTLKELSIVQAPIYKRYVFDEKKLDDIKKKAPILFPDFIDIEGATTIKPNVNTDDTTKNRFVVIIKILKPLSDEDKTKIQKWLNEEISLPTVIIYELAEKKY